MGQLKPALAGAAIFVALTLYAQVGTGPEFEVAVVKPNLSGSNVSTWDPDHHGNFRAENTSLKTLIGTAYHIPKFMIVGPAWIESLRYDINAKGTPGASDAQVNLMLQKLLEERFQLRVHYEAKEMSVYLMEVARSGLKARPVDASKPTDGSASPPGQWTGSYMRMTGTLTEFAGSLSSFAGRPVVDRTGIQGTFVLKLWFNNNPESDGPDLIAALGEELGLKLRAGHASVETLVVDSAKKTPSES